MKPNSLSLPIQQNLLLWLTGKNYTAPTWTDISGGGRNFTTYGGDSNPTKNTGDVDFNGYDSVTFAGNNTKLNYVGRAMTFDNGGGANSGDCMAFIVLRPSSTAVSNFMLGESVPNPGSNTRWTNFRINTTTAILRAQQRWASTGETKEAQGGSALLITQSYVLTMLVNGTSIAIRNNGSAVTSATASLTTPYSPTNTFVGGTVNNNSPVGFTGKIAEVITYSVYNSQYIDPVEQYLLNKYDI